MNQFRPPCTCGASAGEKRRNCPKPRVNRGVVVAVQGALLGALLLAALNGCAAPAPVLTRVQLVPVKVPAGLLTCLPEPAIGTMTMQSQVADYLVQLQEAGADCRADVAAIAKVEAAPAP